VLHGRDDVLMHAEDDFGGDIFGRRLASDFLKLLRGHLHQGLIFIKFPQIFERGPHRFRQEETIMRDGLEVKEDYFILADQVSFLDLLDNVLQSRVLFS
jgi:hypothetical protein